MSERVPMRKWLAVRQVPEQVRRMRDEEIDDNIQDGALDYGCVWCRAPYRAIRVEYQAPVYQQHVASNGLFGLSCQTRLVCTHCGAAWEVELRPRASSAELDMDALVDPEAMLQWCSKTADVPGDASQAVPVGDVRYQAALTRWGPLSQIVQAAKECGALTVALMQYVQERATEEQVAEAVADVEILAEQLREVFGAALVDAAKKRRLAKLDERLAQPD